MTTPGRAKGREDTQPQSPVAVAPPLPNRRNSELVLLGFAAVITTVALLIVEANQESGLQLDLIQFTVGFIVLFGGAHLAVRRYAPYADPLLLPVVALLNGLGLVMIYRLDLSAHSRPAGILPGGNANQQMLWTLLGILVFTAVLMFVHDHRMLARYGYICGLVGLILLAIPAVLPDSVAEQYGAKADPPGVGVGRPVEPDPPQRGRIGGGGGWIHGRQRQAGHAVYAPSSSFPPSTGGHQKYAPDTGRVKRNSASTMPSSSPTMRRRSVVRSRTVAPHPVGDPTRRLAVIVVVVVRGLRHLAHGTVLLERGQQPRHPLGHRGPVGCERRGHERRCLQHDRADACQLGDEAVGRRGRQLEAGETGVHAADVLAADRSLDLVEEPSVGVGGRRRCPRRGRRRAGG